MELTPDCLLGYLLFLLPIGLTGFFGLDGLRGFKGFLGLSGFASSSVMMSIRLC